MAATDVSSGFNGPPAKKLKTEINCEQCGINKSKYTCPKCSFRTCSLPCVKLHKDSTKCDGKREKFDIVKKESQFNDEISIKDQTFLAGVTEGLVTGMKRAKNVTKAVTEQKKDEKKKDESKTEEKMETIESKVKNDDEEDGNDLMIDEKADGGLTIDENDDDTVEAKQDERTEEFQPLNRSEVDETQESENVAMGSQKVQENKNEPENSNQKSDINKNVKEENDEESDFLKKYATRQPGEFTQSLTQNERNLITNVIRRRIFIDIKTPSEADGSFHEHFSDTIFWTIGIRFLKEIPETVEKIEEKEGQNYVLDSNGEETTQIGGFTVAKGNSIVEYPKTARSIPESIRISTLLRQYLKPKVFGVVVSRKDLDEEKMKPFWEANLENVQVFMKVEEGDNERYYLIDKEKSILNNLRNRFVKGHPKFLIVLSNEFKYWKQLSEMESQELHDLRRQKNKERHQVEGNRGRRGGFGQRDHGRGGGFRGRGRGRGGGWNQRGGNNRGRGGFRGGRGRANNVFDLEDIFAPKEDYRVNRPHLRENHQDNDSALSGWANAVKSRYNPPEPETQ